MTQEVSPAGVLPIPLEVVAWNDVLWEASEMHTREGMRGEGNPGWSTRGVRALLWKVVRMYRRRECFGGDALGHMQHVLPQAGISASFLLVLSSTESRPV